MNRNYVTVDEASKISGISPWTLYLHLKLGKIPGVEKAGAQWAIPVSVANNLKPRKRGRPRSDQKGKMA